MCELVNELKVLTDKVISKEHEELNSMFTTEDKITFVNAVRTLQEHSNYLVRELVN